MKGFLSPMKAIGKEVSHLRWRVILFVFSFLFYWGDSFSVDDLQKIDRVKAAFVLNISRFVTWPPGIFETEHSPHLLCLYRSNLLGQAVLTIRGARLSGRALEIETINGLSESNNCTILLIPYREIDRFYADRPENRKLPLLTIADLTEEGAITGVSRRGIMVSMVREGVRIALEVDLRQTHQAGLQVSSQLLKLARILGEEKD